MFFGAGNRSYSGNDSYRHIDPLIRGGKTIYIVSPYIDSYYAAFIRRYAGGKRFYILSSSMTDSARKILESNGDALGMFLFSGVVAAIDILVYLLGLLSVYIILLSLAAIGARWIVFKLASRNRIVLKVPKSFVHAKLYVSDRMAILGSANLTYKGTHVNVEHIEVVHEPDRIGLLKKEFWKLWEEA